MASVYDVYDAFLPKMLEDEWLNWTDEEREEDWRALLDAAIPYFKFLFGRDMWKRNAIIAVSFIVLAIICLI